MRKLYEKIQSPAALLAFEAAGRLSSFTQAAQELNVSQPAISSSVKKLEQALGVVLFHRHHRRIALTDIGERFYADVSFGLMHILRSAEAIAIQRISHHVTLSSSTAFAHYWMVPRLAKFKAMHPDIEIRVQTTDRDLDPKQENASLAIRRGSGDFADCDNFLLAEEHIYPVASPGYLTQHGQPARAEQLLDHPLIHLEEPFRLRPKWADWFEAQGIDYQDAGGGLRFNDYALVIQAAIAGEGIAYGWHHLVEPLIGQGLLRRLMDADYAVGQGFYVIWPRDRELSLQAERFLEWLRDEAQPSKKRDKIHV